MAEFVPEPGRVVLVKLLGYEEPLPAIIVEHYGNGLCRLSVQTGEAERPVLVADAGPLAYHGERGWFRPGDWPQPTTEVPND